MHMRSSLYTWTSVIGVVLAGISLGIAGLSFLIGSLISNWLGVKISPFYSLPFQVMDVI